MAEDIQVEQPEAAASSHVEDVEALRELWRRYGMSLVLGLALVVLVISVAGFVRVRRRLARDRAAQLYASARSVTDLENVIERHGSSSVAPLALLRLAKQYFDAGNYDMALNKYEAFALEYPGHLAADIAHVGRLQCLDAQGEWDEARQGFADFARDNPGHYLAPESVLGEARCLEQLGRHGEARVIYEDFIAANEGSPYVNRAEEALKLVSRTLAREGGSGDAANDAQDPPAAPEAAEATGIPDTVEASE